MIEALPRVVLTVGEPAGIGPDLLTLVAEHAWNCRLLAVADPVVLARRAHQIGCPLELRLCKNIRAIPPHMPGVLHVWPLRAPAPVIPGRLNRANSLHVLETIRFGAEACKAGLADALVTAPVHKGVINDAGYVFSGHTELIAGLTGGEPVMMLVAPGLRVALATTHVPLSEVSRNITRSSLSPILRTLSRELQTRFGIARPRIAVCGLNPHAGENGYLGREEIDVIRPCVEQLQREGLLLEGPIPADTAFVPSRLAETDAVLAMYHDQGLPVLKHLGFGNAVNVTLGLPIIRTSVDHGTALDLAGTGDIDLGSLRAALQLAIELAATARLAAA